MHRIIQLHPGAATGACNTAAPRRPRPLVRRRFYRMRQDAAAGAATAA
ncbi:MAG TPA: hypothetical protein VKY89_24520 [Thermoanaerobaculia bacterium]|nr:hypothetical protein [Thermoanaerobaculia bacterium]